MASLTLTHVDTCLSCYVPDHCNGDDETLIGVAVNSSSRCWHVLDGIREELSNDNKVPAWVSSGMIEEAIRGLTDETYHPFKTFDKSLSSAESVSEDSETPIAWFRASWDATPDDFTEAYLTAALWSSTDESNESGGHSMDDNYDTDDIAPDAMAAALRDCIEWQEKHAKLLKQAYRRYRVSAEYSPEAQAGHDYWLTRNRHGAGFWDRGLGKVGKLLSVAAYSSAQLDLYVGDDKLIHGFGE